MSHTFSADAEYAATPLVSIVIPVYNVVRFLDWWIPPGFLRGFDRSIARPVCAIFNR